MSQDLDQILLLIGAVIGAGFALLFLLARLEPRRPDVLVAVPAAETAAVADLPVDGPDGAA